MLNKKSFQEAVFVTESTWSVKHEENTLRPHLSSACWQRLRSTCPKAIIFHFNSNLLHLLQSRVFRLWVFRAPENVFDVKSVSKMASFFNMTSCYRFTKEVKEKRDSFGFICFKVLKLKLTNDCWGEDEDGFWWHVQEKRPTLTGVRLPSGAAT